MGGGWVGQTFDKIGHHGTMMIGRLLLSLADLHDVVQVTPDIQQETGSSVHLTLKEAEQRVLDVLHSTLHAAQGLQ